MPYTFRPSYHASRCTSISMLEWMALLALCFHLWNWRAPSNASRLYTSLCVVWGLEPYSCHWTLSESQPWTLNLATWGGNFPPFSLRTWPNPSPVACYLAFLFPLPPIFCFQILSKPSQLTVGESIQCDWNYSLAASPRISPKFCNHHSPVEVSNIILFRMVLCPDNGYMVLLQKPSHP